MANLQTKILDFLRREDYQPARPKQLAREMKVGKNNWDKFRAALEELIEAGTVFAGRDGSLRTRSGGILIAGVIKRQSSGAGVFRPHDKIPALGEEPVHVAKKDMQDAHSGDEVLLRLLQRRRSGGQRCGSIEEILDRAGTQFVGTYREQSGQGFVLVDGNTFEAPIFVGDPGAKGAQPEDKVVIEILRFPTQSRGGEGVISEVLGVRGEPGVDLLIVLREFGLRDEFPEEVLAEARRCASTIDEDVVPPGRRDLTGELTLTIDPPDARDFDDAISLTEDADGRWLLGVHIADVSHFVPEGSELDKEAQARGTSVYLPGKVIPMLPELISNGLASLQAGKNRYVVSALIELTADGMPVHAEFCRSVIRVDKRFAYPEVMPIVKDPERHRGKVGAEICGQLKRMHRLSRILRARRYAAGSLELSMPDLEIQLDADGRVTGAEQAHHDESHELIEEFMLAANVAVARALSERSVPFLRRIHGSPDEAKLRDFGKFVEALGYDLPQHQSRAALQELLHQVHGTPHERAVNYALLRSLKQAAYGPEDEGHYALAEEDYCHFTSPIRRYPDLTVHRLLTQLAKSETPRGPSFAGLTRLGKHCSITERKAEKAERELKKIKLLEFLQEQIGLTLEGVITGVERFGLFVAGRELPAEGMIHISALPQEDYYDFDPVARRITGRRSGREFRLGDPLLVEVSHVDVDRRMLDFRIAPPGAKASSPVAKASSTSGKRGRKKTTSDATKAEKATSRKTSSETPARKKSSKKARPSGTGDLSRSKRGRKRK